MKHAKNCMSESMNFAESVHDQVMVGKVYRRIKYLQRVNMDKNLSEVPEDDDEDVQECTSLWASSISGNASGITKRVKWNAE